MNVSTIAVPKDFALQKLEQYRSIRERVLTKEDKQLEALYKAIARNDARVINLRQAFLQTGLNEQKQPRLAIARADWQEFFCRRWSMPGPNYGVRFDNRFGGWEKRVSDIHIPFNKPDKELFTGVLASPVPHIPPRLSSEIQALELSHSL